MEMNNNFSCPICLEIIDESSPHNNITKINLHDLHSVCSNCYENLRKHNILSCPICRHNINDDLRDQIRIMTTHQRIISDSQLKSFGISDSFINILHEQNRIPFYYTGRFEGADFIIQVQEEYNQFIQS